MDDDSPVAIEEVAGSLKPVELPVMRMVFM